MRSIDNEKQASRGARFIRNRSRIGFDRNHGCEEASEVGFAEEENFNVYDLVHRGRQKDKTSGQRVQSPKVLSPTSQRLVSYESIPNREKLLSNKNFSGTSSVFCGTRPLSINYKSGMTKLEKKQAIRQFHKEVQSATLPLINSATVRRQTNLSQGAISKMKQEQTKPKVEYVHEIQYDAKTNVKWTIFNKHAIVVEDEEVVVEKTEEEKILDQLLNEDTVQNDNITAVPERVWLNLYKAKCQDLGIPCKTDKHQERFLTQMLLTQRCNKVCLKDQKLGYYSAKVISEQILTRNEDIMSIDLSNNQLQQNFGVLVKGLTMNSRLVSLTMRNNQVNGSEHGADIKAIIKNHPTLTLIDFSNLEMNVNKNKLKNVGVQAIIEGILETEGASIISDISLSYNFLTSACLPHFALLSDPNFI